MSELNKMNQDQDNQKCICIDELLNTLAAFRARFGNIPVLISAEGSDEDFLKPMKTVFGINMTNLDTDENQPAIVLANYIITDNDDDTDDNLIELRIGF